MKTTVLSALSLITVMTLSAQAQFTTDFSFSGSGVSGSGTFTYTPQADGADKITGITGTFSDANTMFNGNPVTAIMNANITGLVAINPVTPLPPAVLAPDFSRFAIANGVPSPPAGEASLSLSYDNTFYPGGAPVVCLDYPFSGGMFDVYGLLFQISNGDVVALWSNGGPLGYGVAVADSNNTYDYVGGVSAVPEPSTGSLMALALAGMILIRRRKAQAA